LSSSAPILYFKDSPTAKEDAFGDIITAAYSNISAKCSTTIKNGWDMLMNMKVRSGDWI
jgi:hypothetical protein